MRELKTYKGQLEVLASRLDHIYQTLASNLLPSLLKAYNESGSQLNRFQFNGDDLRLYDIVFDPKTYK